MATQKQTEAVKPTAPIAAPSNGAAPIVVQADAPVESLFTTASASKDDAAMLEKALADKEGKLFVKPEADFWKPENVGDKLIGNYLGSEKQGRLIQHGFRVKGKDGYRVVRMNGSHMVTRALGDCRVGRVVQLVYLGQEKTSTDGRKLNKFEIGFAEE